MSTKRPSNRFHFLTGFTFLSRLLLVLVFLISGVSKVISPETATEFFAKIWQVDASITRMGIIGISVAELVLAALLALRPKMLAPPLVACSFFLASIVIGGSYAEPDIACGCFGRVIDSRINEDNFLRNTALLLVSLFVLRTTPSTRLTQMEASR